MPIQLRLLGSIWGVVFCGLLAQAQPVMPGPEDDLYRALRSSFEQAGQLAKDCNAGKTLKVQLNSDQNLPGYLPGQVYGAEVCGRLEYPYTQLEQVFSKPGAIWEALRRVKTFGEMTLIKQTEGAAYSQFEILVPVLSNYIVKSWTHFEITSDRATLHWYQEDDGSQLLNNRGYMVFVPSGSITKVYLNSYHVLKANHRIKFPISGLAPGFTRDHYGNYYWAVLNYAQEFRLQK